MYLICSDTLAERLRIDMKVLTVGDVEHKLRAESEKRSATSIKDQKKIEQNEEIFKKYNVVLQEEIDSSAAVRRKKIDRTVDLKIELIKGTKGLISGRVFK